MAQLTGNRPNRFALPPMLLVVALAGVAVVGNVVSLPQAESEMLTLCYLAFVVISVFVGRRVALRPGGWLGLRLVRRGIRDWLDRTLRVTVAVAAKGRVLHSS